MKTRITELFKIECPIIQGGMHYAGFVELAASGGMATGTQLVAALVLGVVRVEMEPPQKLRKKVFPGKIFPLHVKSEYEYFPGH